MGVHRNIYAVPHVITNYVMYLGNKEEELMGLFSYDDVNTSVSMEGDKVGGSHDHSNSDGSRHHTDYSNNVGHNSYDYNSPSTADRTNEHYTPHN
jgi:hypothetical protein